MRTDDDCFVRMFTLALQHTDHIFHVRIFVRHTGLTIGRTSGELGTLWLEFLVDFVLNFRQGFAEYTLDNWIDHRASTKENRQFAMTAVHAGARESKHLVKVAV